MALKDFSSTGPQVKTLDLITFRNGATNLLYCGMYALLYENWQTLINNSPRLLGVLMLARRLRLSTGIPLNPNREEQVPPEILDLGFFQPHLSRPNPARNKIKDPETRPNSRNFSFTFLILSCIQFK